MRTPSSTRLRAMLAEPDRIIACPGVFDGLTARMALHAGFDALYMTGAGTSMSRIGMADLGLATFTDMRDNASMIASLDPSVPLIADADTGYGTAINVARTVAGYISAGVAAFHLEDQVVTKRCGHLAGKEVVSSEEYLTRIRAAVRVREEMKSDIVIIARTDALAVLGLDEAISRLKAAVQAGADVAFLEAITTREEIKVLSAAFHKTQTPLMYGMVQGSKAPALTVQEAKELGFKIIVYAALCLAPIYLGVTKAMETLKTTGDCESYGEAANPHKMFDVCGMTRLLAFDREVSARPPAESVESTRISSIEHGH